MKGKKQQCRQSFMSVPRCTEPTLRSRGHCLLLGEVTLRILFQVILKGSKERSTGATGVNADSSRSHAVIQIQIKDSAKRAFGR